jgi:hypothetical protein
LDGILSAETLLGEMVVVIAGGGIEESADSPVLKTVDDIYAYFLEKHKISKNKIKSILMKRGRGGGTEPEKNDPVKGHSA